MILNNCNRSEWQMTTCSKSRCSPVDILAGTHWRPLYFQGFYGAAFKDTLFDCQSTQSNSPYPIGKQESGRTFCVGWERHCSWSLRLSQTYESLEISRLEYATHFGSEPNGRLEEPWRSAPCKVWKARFDQMDHFRVTRHVFTSPRCFCPHLKSLQIS